jgi:hypothetical protein
MGSLISILGRLADVGIPMAIKMKWISIEESKNIIEIINMIKLIFPINKEELNSGEDADNKATSPGFNFFNNNNNNNNKNENKEEYKSNKSYKEVLENKKENIIKVNEWRKVSNKKGKDTKNVEDEDIKKDIKIANLYDFSIFENDDKLLKEDIEMSIYNISFQKRFNNKLKRKVKSKENIEEMIDNYIEENKKYMEENKDKLSENAKETVKQKINYSKKVALQYLEQYEQIKRVLTSTSSSSSSSSSRRQGDEIDMEVNNKDKAKSIITKINMEKLISQFPEMDRNSKEFINKLKNRCQFDLNAFETTTMTGMLPGYMCHLHRTNYSHNSANCSRICEMKLNNEWKSSTKSAVDKGAFEEMIMKNLEAKD